MRPTMPPPERPPARGMQAGLRSASSLGGPRTPPLERPAAQAKKPAHGNRRTARPGNPRPPQPRGARRRAGGARLAAAGHLHPRRPRRAAARAEQVPRDAADLGDHPRLDAVGAAARRPDAAPRPAARLLARRRRRRRRLGALRAGAGRRAPSALFLAGSLLSGLYMSAQGFYRFAATDGASEGFRPKAISRVMARRPRLGDPRAAARQAHRRRARAGALRRRLRRARRR